MTNKEFAIAFGLGMFAGAYLVRNYYRYYTWKDILEQSKAQAKKCGGWIYKEYEDGRLKMEFQPKEVMI